MRKITERDKDILKFIEEFHAENQYSPSLREICLACHIGKSSAQRHIIRLIECGYMSAEPKKPRSYVVKIAI